MNPLLPQPQNHQNNANPLNLQIPPLGPLPTPPALPPVMRVVNPEDDKQAGEKDAHRQQGEKRKRSESYAELSVKSARIEEPPAPPVTLIELIQRGDIEAASTKLRSSPALIERIDSASGLTPLCAAAKAGQIAIVQVLCTQLQANPSTPSANGNSALMFAAEAGHVDIVRELLKIRASIFQTNFEGKTALHFAATCGEDQLIFMLHRIGASLNQKSLTGETALMVAAKHGHIKAVSQLLRLGALIDLQDDDGNAALMYVCQENNLAIFNVLLAVNADLDMINFTGQTCLMMACTAGHAEIAKRLIQAGALLDLPNCRGAFGDSALHLVCRDGNTEMAKLLLESGAITYSLNQGGQTPLQLASSTGQVDIVRHLIPLKSLRDHIDNNGKTALSVACANGFTEIVQLLVENGANPATLDTHGEDKNLNALDVAIKYSRYNVVEFLIRQGCTVSRISPDSSIPQQSVKDPVCIDLLRHAALIATPDTAASHGLQSTLQISQPALFIEELIAQLTKKESAWKTWAVEQGLSFCIVDEVARHMAHMQQQIKALFKRKNLPPPALGHQIVAGLFVISLKADSLKNIFSNKKLSSKTETAFNGMVDQQCKFLMQASKEIQQRIKRKSLINQCVNNIGITGELNESMLINMLSSVNGIYIQNINRLIPLFREALKIAKGKAADLPPFGSVGQVQLQSGTRIVALMDSTFTALLQKNVHDSSAPPEFRASFDALKEQAAQDDFVSLVFDQWRLICVAHDVEPPVFQ